MHRQRPRGREARRGGLGVPLPTGDGVTARTGRKGRLRRRYAIGLRPPLDGPTRPLQARHLWRAGLSWSGRDGPERRTQLPNELDDLDHANHRCSGLPSASRTALDAIASGVPSSARRTRRSGEPSSVVRVRGSHLGRWSHGGGVPRRGRSLSPLRGLRVPDPIRNRRPRGALRPKHLPALAHEPDPVDLRAVERAEQDAARTRLRPVHDDPRVH